MKYELIFYIAKKTGYCEKRLRALLRAIGASVNHVVSATDPTSLGEQVTHSLSLCPLVIIVGGQHSPDDDNITVVLSRAFSTTGLTLENMRRITAPSGAVGYAVRYKSQMLLSLPDSPDDIEAMLSGDLLRYIGEKLK